MCTFVVECELWRKKDSSFRDEKSIKRYSISFSRFNRIQNRSARPWHTFQREIKMFFKWFSKKRYYYLKSRKMKCIQFVNTSFTGMISDCTYDAEYNSAKYDCTIFENGAINSKLLNIYSMSPTYNPIQQVFMIWFVSNLMLRYVTNNMNGNASTYFNICLLIHLTTPSLKRRSSQA